MTYDLKSHAHLTNSAASQQHKTNISIGLLTTNLYMLFMDPHDIAYIQENGIDLP